MKLFSPLFAKVMQWSRHRHAPYYLSGLSFAEACVLPFPPPDVMLAPMSLARPARAWWYAALTTVTSVLGGLFGYLIGLFFFELISPLLHDYGYWDKYLLAESKFREWGVWAVFIAGFSPIPYKIFTISAGVLHMSLLPFIVASLLGRGARFFLVAALMVWGGEKMEKKLHQYVDVIGWIMVLLVGVLYFVLRG
ncbi:MAG: DedA family protein [Gammaproteobacteria bacterium]|nr:DedA family protein [Gammaproteobacteria bacterium]